MLIILYVISAFLLIEILRNFGSDELGIPQKLIIMYCLPFSLSVIFVWGLLDGYKNYHDYSELKKEIKGLLTALSEIFN